MNNNVWCNSNPSKTSKLMICFLFFSNHQETSLSPQHCQLPGRGTEGKQRNSWTHKFALMHLQGHTTNTNICWVLGGGFLKGSRRRKEGEAIAQPWLPLAASAGSSSVKHQQSDKTLLDEILSFWHDSRDLRIPSDRVHDSLHYGLHWVITGSSPWVILL